MHELLSNAQIPRSLRMTNGKNLDPGKLKTGYTRNVSQLFDELGLGWLSGWIAGNLKPIRNKDPENRSCLKRSASSGVAC
jgi:hypothetical protein